ncbi:MAG: iron-sulfur cluster assembly accessory protein [Planctomycetaceae bacterium]|jgi:iron-sulfur cluster assembly accessory protein|nr:iron-sulfur cluster assembly accessory protein [Planctomycetaceae bacterium]MBN8604505.1 iron-sulfur cluster assembly accessory protein [Planctomycetota bacterium]
MAVILTEKAAEQIKKFRVENNCSDESFLRIGVTGGGCSGLGYAIAFDENFDDAKDSRYEQHGVAVVVDKKSALYLDGLKIDWYQSFEKQGFTFDNPNAVKTCGCGSSFQA